MFIINQNNQHDGHIFIVLPSTIETPARRRIAIRVQYFVHTA